MKQLLFFLFAITSIQAQTDTTIYTIVDQMPRFPGCEELEGDNDSKKSCADQKFLSYIYNNLHIPAAVDKSQIGSRLVFSFVVNKDGTIEQVTILKSMHPLIDEHVTTLIQNIPQWTAGTLKGTPVNVKYNFPLRLCFK